MSSLSRLEAKEKILLQDDDTIRFIKEISDLNGCKKVFITYDSSGKLPFHNVKKAIEALKMLQIDIEINSC